MRPIKQTRIDAENGDCTEAAIASIFECEIGDVPPFPPRTASDADKDAHWSALRLWLQERGADIMRCEGLRDGFFADPPNTYWIATIRSPLGYHAVVMRGADCVWDSERGAETTVAPADIEEAWFFLVADLPRQQTPTPQPPVRGRG